VSVVLDTWAVLRYLDGTDPAATMVDELVALERPAMSWINVGEVHYVLRRAYGDLEAVATVRDLGDAVDLVPPVPVSVTAAARIKADHPMSYADAFAAALAVERGAVLWTGAPELLVDGALWSWRDLRSA